MNDNGREKLMDRLLTHLATRGDDGRLRELARGIRQGSAGWAESVAAPAYAEALQPGLDGFLGWYRHLSESDRAAAAAQCEREVDQLNRTPMGLPERRW